LGYYLSDADHDIADRNEKSLLEVQQAFRYGLDINITARVLSKYDTHQILTDTTVEARKELGALHKTLSYRYEKPGGKLYKEPEKKGVKNWFKKKKTTREKVDDAEDLSNYDFVDGSVRRAEVERKYMHAKIYNTEALEHFHTKYGTDLFLFINQFELKTNYQHCLDRATNNFVRDVLVHFSIYNVAGEFLYGDVITVMFSSNTNDLGKIIQKNFPVIGDEISERLPQPSVIKEAGGTNDEK
jgi:hypothetical protein